MDIIKLKAFITATDSGSFTKAAEKMGYSQPGIGKMINSLEKELNIILFTRNNSLIEITPEGKKLYRYSKEIVKDYDRMMDASRAMADVPSSLSIAAANSVMTDFIPSLLVEYAKSHELFPMTLMEYAHSSIVEAVLEGNTDIGVTSTFSDASVTFIPLFKDPARLIVPLGHPLAKTDEISVRDLDGCDLLTIPDIGDDVILAAKKIYRFTPRSLFTIHSDVGAISMVDKGFGCYLLSEMQCVRLGSNTKKIRLKEPVYRTIGAGIPKYKLQIPSIKAFLQFAIEFGEKYEEELKMR